MKRYGEGFIKVWDPLIRVFHWSLLIFFVAALATGEGGGRVHVFLGLAIAAMLVVRIVWGFIGPRHARFTDFVRGPSEVRTYLKGLFGGRIRHYIGHNPAGGAMVVVMLIALSLTCITGIKAYAGHSRGAHEAYATLSLTSVAYAGVDADEPEEGAYGEGEWEEIHEFLAFFTLALAAVHLSGVVAASVLHRENLIKAMITGYKHR